MLQFLGFLLPPLIDLINKKNPDSDMRFWVSFAVCTIFGVAIDVITKDGLGGYSGMTMLQKVDELSTSAMMVFGLAQLSYKAVWETSEQRSKLKLDIHKK